MAHGIGILLRLAAREVRHVGLARAGTPDPITRLERLAALAVAIDAPAIERAALRWAERVADGLFYVACVGQFKRGKSTLLNALIERAVLPTGVVPVTAVVTILRYGDRDTARVHFLAGDSVEIAPEALPAYVSEQGNPANGKGVSLVEVFAPSALLASGMCLVDTPGLGSIFLENDQATRSFAPHIDAALVVLGGDPPISGEELALLRALSDHVQHFLFVLNKADRLLEEELDAARRFSERVLQEKLGRSPGALFEISAAQRLRGTGPDRDFEALSLALRSLAAGAGDELRRGATNRGVGQLADRLRGEIELRRQALVQPFAASEREIARLRACAEQALRSLQDLGYLFQGEQDRIAQELARGRARFLAQAIPDAYRRAVERLEACREISRRRLPSEALRIAACVASDTLECWRAEEEPIVEELYRRAGMRFVKLANHFLDQLAQSGDPSFASHLAALRPETTLHGKPRFHFQTLEWLAREHRWDQMLDLASPRPILRRRLEKRMRKYLDRLFEMSATRIQTDFGERILESRRRLEGELRSQFSEIHGSAQRALERARRLRAEGAAAVDAELDRLAGLEEEIARIAAPEPAARSFVSQSAG